MRNHNNLLGNVRGVDGIKTGYTAGSGYNLCARCADCDDRHIVAVVPGGTRMRRAMICMRQLIRSKYHCLRVDSAHGADRCRGQGTDSAPVTAMARAHVRAGFGAQQAGPAYGAEAAGPGCKARG